MVAPSLPLNDKMQRFDIFVEQCVRHFQLIDFLCKPLDLLSILDLCEAHLSVAMMAGGSYILCCQVTYKYQALKPRSTIAASEYRSYRKGEFLTEALSMFWREQSLLSSPASIFPIFVICSFLASNPLREHQAGQHMICQKDTRPDDVKFVMCRLCNHAIIDP